MSILEPTKERLVIGREENTRASDLVGGALLIGMLIKSKFLLWYPTTHYALNEIVQVELVTRNFYAGSTTVKPMEVVRLTRSRDGRTFQEEILYGADANHSMVYQINRFPNHSISEHSYLNTVKRRICEC